MQVLSCLLRQTTMKYMMSLNVYILIAKCDRVSLPFTWISNILVNELTHKKVNTIWQNKTTYIEKLLFTPAVVFIIKYLSYIIIAILLNSVYKDSLKTIDRINCSSQIWLAIVILSGSALNPNKFKMKWKAILYPWVKIQLLNYNFEYYFIRKLK